MKFVFADTTATAREILEAIDKRIEMLENAQEETDNIDDAEMYMGKLATADAIRNDVLRIFKRKTPETLYTERATA